MMESSRARRGVVVAGLVAAVVLVGLGVLVARAKAADDGARDAAATYVDLVATGDDDDLERLWAMSVTESPGGLRAAGQMLVDAEERIEVVSVGDPTEAPLLDVPYPAVFEEFVEVEVRYRLDGQEHEGALVLGRLEGEDGADESDWRVTGPLLGAIGWEQAAFGGAAADAYVSGVRQVRRAVLGGSGEDTQPLFPAVYRTQSRLDPWFASAPESVTVLAGEPTPQPSYRLDPTERTQERIRRQVLATFDQCGRSDFHHVCPVDDLAESRGVVETYRGGWFLGLSTVPEIRVAHDGITLSGGVFRLRAPDGVHEVRFDGTGRYFIDNQAWVPVLAPYEFETREEAR